MRAHAALGLVRVFGPAVIALVFLGLWQASLRQRDHARAEVKQRDIVIATDRASYRAATVIAERANAARIATIEARHLASKKEADLAYATDLARGQRLAADYIATHRVQPNPAAATAGGRAGAGTASQAPAIAAKPDRSGQNAVLVTSQDIEICTENSVRIRNAVDWALGLDKLRNAP